MDYVFFVLQYVYGYFQYLVGFQVFVVVGEVDVGCGVVVFVYFMCVVWQCNVVFVFGECVWIEGCEFGVVLVYYVVEVGGWVGGDQLFGEWCWLDQEELVLVGVCEGFGGLFVY